MFTLKMVYSLEANQEAEEIINNLKHYISIQGNLVRIVKNEAFLSYFCLTSY